MLVEATSVKTVADRVFNLLKGYGFQIDTYNKMGEVVGDPADAIRFFVEDPNLLVTLNVPKEEIRLSISDNTDQTDTLRKQLSEIAKDYLMMLDFRVFGKTLKPSSEAINISRESDMKEQNELRKLAGLEPINEDRTVVGCKDGKELYIFLGNEQIDLGQSEEEVASKLLSLGDKVDFDDMFYSSSMDFARECGFASNDGAKKLMDKAIDLMMDMKFAKSGEKISADMPKMDFEEAEEGPGGVEDCIRMVLRKEGGAAGLGAIEDACKKAGFEDDVKSVMSSMSDVEQHSEGDYLLKEEDEDKPGEMVRYFLKQDFTQMSKEDASTIVSNIAYEKFPSYDMHDDPLDGALDELHDMLDSESMSGYQFDRGEMDNPDVDDFELSDSDYKSLPKIQQIVRDKYIERMNDPDIKDELPGMNVPQESKEDNDYEKSYDFEPTPEAEAWYNSIVDHDDLDNMYNQWEEAFSQADTEDKVDVALHHVQGLLADGPLDDYNTLWQAWEQDEDIEDMLPKYQAMAKKSAGTPELPMMGEAETIVVEASLGSMRGSIKTSNQPLGGTKIIVKHTKAVNEEVRGSRSRNIQKIFIENNEERFLFPSKNLNGARAMARHLYNGGQMHDTVGESIVAMCTELKTLKEFANYVKKQGLINEENNDYVELARQHISTIKETFKKLSGVKTYSKAVESLKDMNNIDVVNEVNLEDHFTETHFDDKVGKVHETISKLVNKQTAFESMIMKTIESENFVGIKELISEDPLDFATPEAKLGHQVSQLGSTAKNPQLASYLGSISNKLSNGGQMNQFEYRAVKASLLSAQRTDHAEMAHTVTEEEKYTDFINSFIQD